MPILFVLAGCGTDGPPLITGRVKITVKYDGKPVTEGTVNMVVPNTAKGATGQLKKDGTLLLDDVEVGEYVVAVLPPELSVDELPDPDKPSPPAKTYDNLPQKFRSLETSTLKAEVKEGENTFEFDLKE